MAEQSMSLRDNHQAIACYKEALKFSADDTKAMAALARIYMHVSSAYLTDFHRATCTRVNIYWYLQVNQMDECQEICSRLLRNDVNNEVALVIMADISFRKVCTETQIFNTIIKINYFLLLMDKMDFRSASHHFSQLLLNKPTYWIALARLIEVMRRSAKIDEASEFIQRGEQNCLKPNEEAGLYSNSILMLNPYNICMHLAEQV